MCANYTPPSPEALRRRFGVRAVPEDIRPEVYPGDVAPIVRLADDGSGELECVNACFGLMPHWARPTLYRHTYNARSETATTKPSFRHAVSRRQWCIVPAAAIFEPNYESGRAVRWKIQAQDHEALGLAGLWEWRPNGGPNDQPLLSFTLLTIAADQHSLMQRFHAPEDEKRMVVVLPAERFLLWLQTAEMTPFLQPYPAQRMTAEPAPRTTAARKKSALPKAQPKSQPSTRALWDDDETV